MNIQQIKVEIANKAQLSNPITALNMVRQMVEGTENDPKPTPTEWLSHWDNDNRVRVTMHETVFEQIKANPLMEGLAVKHEVVQPEDETKAPYLRFVVITPRFIEGVF